MDQEKTERSLIDQVINLGIPHVAQKIFNHITTAKLVDLCQVSKSWRQLIVDEILMGTRIHFDVVSKKPLMFACIDGNVDLAEMLLNHPKSDEITVNARCFNGMTALMYACKLGHTKVVELLLNHSDSKNINLNALCRSNRNAFIYACEYGQTETVKLLLTYTGCKQQIAFNKKSIYSRTALMLVCEKGYIKIVKLLLHYAQTKGINLNQTDTSGLTALRLALQNFHFSIVSLFLERKSYKWTGNELNHVLMAACGYRSKVSIVKAILNHPQSTKINFNKQDNSLGPNYTAYILACLYGHKEIVQLFIDHSKRNHIVLDQREKICGKNGLMIACQAGKVDVVKLFLECPTRIDMSAKDNYGRTAFMFACHDGRIAVVKVLLDYAERKGIQLNATDVFGRTGLMIALENGQDEVFKLLIEESTSKHILIPRKSDFDVDKLATINPEIITLLEEKWELMAQREAELFNGHDEENMNLEQPNEALEVDTNSVQLFNEHEESRAKKAKLQEDAAEGDTNSNEAKLQDFQLDQAETYGDMLEDLEYIEDEDGDNDDSDDDMDDENEDQ